MTKTLKYYFLGLALCFCYLTLVSQNKNIDSLLTLIKTDKSDTNKVIHSNNLCMEYANIGNYYTALEFSNIALQLSQQLNFKKGIAGSYATIGTVHYYKGDYSKALDYYLKALKLVEELKNKKGKAIILGNIGLIHYDQADYLKALNYYFRALKLDEELKNKNGIARHLGNIGSVYDVQAEYPQALFYYFKAEKMYEDLGLKNDIAINLGNIGAAYKEQKNFSKGLDYNFKALEIAEELGDKYTIAICLDNIGSIYISTKKFNEAEQYLERAASLNDSIGSRFSLVVAEENLTQLYDNTGRFKDALIHYKKAMALKDTILSQENKKQLVRKEMNYEFDKKEIEAKALQDKKDAITVEEKQRQTVIIYSVSVGLFLVLLLALFILRGYKQKQKANWIITQQKVEVEKQKELVELKNKEITDSINYAKRIQQAKLPKKEEIYAALPQSFVLFKPKDIVSGDFYFFHKKEQIVFIAAADCTGHGVPGAFMSMIGSEKLEDAVSQTTDTSEILNLLNIGIKTSLHQSEMNGSTRDGMDIALLRIDLTGFQNLSGLAELNYSGANRPIWIIRKGQTEVEETKATKKAIGGFTEDKQYFETHELKLKLGDTLFIFTDGYADQFGGIGGKKLMTSKFKEILLGIQDKTMQEQEKQLDIFADKWRGNREQIDDILVIGIRM